jgi:large subunit ribosomal protein L4e
MKRQAAASCIAATGVVPMVMGRGHRVEKVQEFPIVVSNDIEGLTKTRDAVAALESLNLGDELTKCQRKQSRPGKGSMRGRRYKRRRGPLIVYKEDNGLVKAFRNIPGVDLCSVDCLNVLQLAPGGHSGRLVVYTQNALESLNTWLNGKKAPKVIMTNSDVQALINSDEIQSVIRDKRSITRPLSSL